MADLSLDFCGVPLRSPVVVAPAAITETADRMKRCEAHGAGAVVVKSYFQEEVCRVAPTPRFRLLRHAVGRHKSFTLYSYEQAHIYGLTEFGREIERAKRELSIPIFGSINCTTPEGWAEAARVCEEAGADLLELNVSCPHGVHLMSGADMTDSMVQALQSARTGTSLPLVPKMSAQLSHPPSVVRALEEAGADGVVMFNRLTGLDIDLETERPIMHGGYAGHGGPWAIHLVLRWLTAVAPQSGLPIAASGGVASGDDVAKLILAGATTVQTCTAIVLQGYEFLEKLNEGLVSFMDAKGYERLEDFRGKAAGTVVGLQEVVREHNCYAVIDADRCTACDTCRRVCIYDAVQKGDVYHIVPELCDGCGLCVELCPVQCIEMQTFES